MYNENLSSPEKIRAIAVDLDGTLTYPDRRLDFRGVEALRRLDIPIIIATGNIACFASAAAKLIGTGGAVIAETGGIVKTEFDGKEHILGDSSKPEKAFQVLSQHMEMEKLDTKYRQTDVVVRRNIDINAARIIVEKAYPDVEVIDSGFAVHIKNRNVNKGTGLRKLAELLHIHVDDIVAIGDSDNDVEMFEVAGFAVAVANSTQKLKSVANMVTESEYGAGVAEAVASLFQ